MMAISKVKKHPGMEYELTDHAEDAIQKRQIATAWIEPALKKPDFREPDPVDPDLEHRLARIAERGGRALRVILNVTTRPPRIVTLFFDRRV
jgi:hypothetical protein